jgi:diguanylate cyclase (GGDEF)-like protein
VVDVMVQARATLGRWLHAIASLRRDRVLLALGGGTAAAALGYALDLGTRSAQVIGAWAFIAAIHVCLGGVARTVSRAPDLTRAARRFWRAVAVAGLIYLAGDLAQIVTAARHPLTATAATGDPIQLGTLSLGSAWLGLALLMSPLGLTSRRERERFWLDVATVMVAAAVVGWYLIVPDRPAALLNAAAPVLMGPVILLLCVFVVAKLTMSGTAPFTRWTAAVGALAAAAKSGADTIGPDGLGGSRLHWFLALTVSSHALLAIAVRVNHLQVTGNPDVLRVRRRRPYSLLPYGAIAVTYVLLTVAIWRGDAATVPIALGAAAISTALVVVRQLAAFRENARLLGELRESLAERDDLAARLRHQAFHDGLTGLPNRALYSERLDGALAQPGGVAVMLVDLDDFKLVNDAWGHAAGDALLCEIADRLRACVRPSDTVARLGGDEFAVLLCHQPGDDPGTIAGRIVAAVEAPVPVDGGSARVGASVGIAVSHAAADGEALLREADHAMYEVKRAGKGSFAIAPY